MKWMFASDGDCHNFLIPLDKKELFDQLLEHGESDGYESFNNEFADYSIDGIEGCYIFENPEKII